MCLDWSEVELQGNYDQDIAKTLDVALLPCNMKESVLTYGQMTDSIPDNCNYD